VDVYSSHNGDSGPTNIVWPYMLHWRQLRKRPRFTRGRTYKRPNLRNWYFDVFPITIVFHSGNKYGFEASDIWLDPSCLLEVNYSGGKGGDEQVKSWTPNGQNGMGRGYLNMQSMSQTWWFPANLCTSSINGLLILQPIKVMK